MKSFLEVRNPHVLIHVKINQVHFNSCLLSIIDTYPITIDNVKYCKLCSNDISYCVKCDNASICLECPSTHFLSSTNTSCITSCLKETG